MECIIKRNIIRLLVYDLKEVYVTLSDFDRDCMAKAIALAIETEKAGNLPIGAVIAYRQEIITVGKNTIWQPGTSLHRHAEMEALMALPQPLVQYTSEMTLYTTLEPCLMCMGAILLYGIGRVLYGSRDNFGGADTVIHTLPPFFRKQIKETEWIGPAYPGECDVLFKRIQTHEEMRKLGMHPE